VLHLARHVGQEEHLAVAGAGDERELGVARVLDDEARVLQAVLAAHAFEVALPALAVGRVGEHEVELARRERVVGQGRMLRAADDVVCRLALALEQEVGLADGVGLGVDLLAVEVRGDLLAVRPGEPLERLFPHGEHAAGAAGGVVEEVRPRLDPVGDGEEDQVGHQLDGVAGRPVLPGLLVVLLVEPADQLLEDGPHRVVVEAGQLDRAVTVEDGLRAEVDVRREELLDQRAEGVGLREAGDLVAELKAVEDVLDVRREPVEVVLEVALELLLGGPRLQVAERELRRVVERLTGGLAERGVLVGDSRPVHRGLHVEHGLLGRLQHGVEPAQDGHRQDDVAVLAPHVEVAEDVVGDAPDEVDDGVVGG